MNIYAAITERILKQLAAGVVPWRKTWVTGLPKSLSTHKEYRGINILLLGLTGFTSRYWITFREAKRLGGFVRQGEKATPVYFWHWRTAEELATLRKKSGKANLAPCTSFTSFVFNLDQVEGIARPEDDLPNYIHNPLEVAELMLSAMPDKPRIIHAHIGEPSYHRLTDCVTMPHLSQFHSAEHYFGILYHEIIHATGAKSRLNRFAESEGDARERYSFEELVAEFGASFLGGFTGINNPDTEALSASYIEGWASVFRQDSHILLRAASAAQRAADYVRGKIIVEDSPQPADQVTMAAA